MDGSATPNNTTTIIIVVVAVVAVILIALAVLLAVKKKGGAKTQTDVLTASKDLIAANAQSVSSLLVLAEGKEGVTQELNKLQDKLKYLTPSTDEKVRLIDEKIKDELGDLKIELNKKKEEEKDDKVHSILENIRLKIADRSVLTDRL